MFAETDDFRRKPQCVCVGVCGCLIPAMQLGSNSQDLRAWAFGSNSFQEIFKGRSLQCGFWPRNSQTLIWILLRMFWWKFFLLFFLQRKKAPKIHKKSPAKFTRKFVQKNSFGFLQKPFLENCPATSTPKALMGRVLRYESLRCESWKVCCATAEMSGGHYHPRRRAQGWRRRRRTRSSAVQNGGLVLCASSLGAPQSPKRKNSRKRTRKWDFHRSRKGTKTGTKARFLLSFLPKACFCALMVLFLEFVETRFAPEFRPASGVPHQLKSLRTWQTYSYASSGLMCHK